MDNICATGCTLLCASESFDLIITNWLINLADKMTDILINCSAVGPVRYYRPLSFSNFIILRLTVRSVSHADVAVEKYS